MGIIKGAFGRMKTRFRPIFLQVLEVHHTFVLLVSQHPVSFQILKINIYSVYTWLWEKYYIYILHNICLSAGDIVAPKDQPKEDAVEDEGEAGLESVSGALWWDQLSAEVSGLTEVPADHD